MQWSPPVSKENKDGEKNKNNNASPYEEPRFDVKKDIKGVKQMNAAGGGGGGGVMQQVKIDENYFGPEKDSENDNPPPMKLEKNDSSQLSSGNDDGSIGDSTRDDDDSKHSDNGRKNADDKNSTKINDSNHSNNSSNYHGEGSDDDGGRCSDEDVECTADMAFRSGLTFKISTRLWCNWPRDRYASLPVTIILELVEISGRVRFGVDHGSSFVSFLEDPLTRFAVHTEVGGDSFKLKDIPKLSDFIVKKLKDFILKKLVHPKAHRFRLIWPRNWWPEDTQGGFTSSSTANSNSSSNSSEKPDESKSEINTKKSKPENDKLNGHEKSIKKSVKQPVKGTSSSVEENKKEKLHPDKKIDDPVLHDNLSSVPVKMAPSPLRPAAGTSVLVRSLSGKSVSFTDPGNVPTTKELAIAAGINMLMILVYI